MGFTVASEQAVTTIYPRADILYIPAAIRQNNASVKIYQVRIIC
jgi:hypothetical protein